MTILSGSTEPRELKPEERFKGEGRPAALEIREPFVAAAVHTSPALQPGDVADLWHQGTKKYYRVTIQHQVTEQEAFGV